MDKTLLGSPLPVLLAALLCAASGRAATADARVIPYDGYLENSGLPAQGPHVFHTQLFADPGDVAPLWSEYYTVQVEAGRFFISIGGEDGQPLSEELYSVSDLHLGLDVNGEQLAGRQRIMALPFATNTSRAGHLRADEISISSAAATWLHLAHDGTDGRAPQAWTVGLGEATSLFLIEDTTNGAQRPFAIQPGAPDAALYVASDGDVGVGTGAPAHALHLRGSDGNTALAIEETHATPSVRTLLLLHNSGRVVQRFESDNTGGVWLLSSGAEFRITRDASGTTELELGENGDLRIAGSYYSNGTELSVPDHVFAPEHALMPLDQLERYVQRERHLPGISSAAEVKRDGLNLTELQLRLLEKVEELTLYTIEQHKELEALRHEREALERRLLEVETALADSRR